MDRFAALTTDRLLLTPLQLEDSDTIQQLFPCWEVVRYLDRRVPWPYPDDGALTYVRDVALRGMAEGREWHWMIRMRDDADCTLGSISLYDQPGNNRGFWLAPQRWGRGYMREAAGLSTRIGSRPWLARSCRSPKRLPTTHHARCRNMRACAL